MEPEEDVYTQIARKIIAIPENKPEHSADHKLMRTAEIIKNAMRMAERHAVSLPSEASEQKEGIKCPFCECHVFDRFELRNHLIYDCLK